MSITARELSSLFSGCQDHMRNIDGLQPQEAFDELLKYVFVKECAEEYNHRFPDLCQSVFNTDTVSLNRGLIGDLRCQLRAFLERQDSWGAALWVDKEFHLTDSALLAIHELFESVELSAIDIDTRNLALNEFVPKELRRGLGIFPTPNCIARMMVEIADPEPQSRVFDPACGTGTFLVEVIRHWRNASENGSRHSIWGIDKNPRMLMLSELNLGHDRSIEYRRELADSLYESPSVLFGDVEGGFDYIFTNPPFGVIIDRDRNDMTPFSTCLDARKSYVKRQQSEVIFVEQCLKYLKPGGSAGNSLTKKCSH